MKNKLIIILSSILFFVVIYFQYNELKREKKEIKQLETIIDEITLQNELNRKDSIKRNEEFKNAQKEAYLLQEKTQLIKGGKCLDINVNSDFAKLLHENHKM